MGTNLHGSKKKQSRAGEFLGVLKIYKIQYQKRQNRIKTLTYEITFQKNISVLSSSRMLKLNNLKIKTKTKKEKKIKGKN